MGRASRWLRNLLGGKKATEDQSARQKKGWGFVKTFQKDRPATAVVVSRDEQSMRATAVAEAALEAERAAATVALLTTGGSPARMKMEELAAVKIQSSFRGYLARRALRALKGLVKIQALVRGNIVRKQAAETLRCMKALVRVQTRARTFRALHSNPGSSKSSHSYPGPATPENYESISSKWMDEEPNWNMREASKYMDDEKSTKKLEVDNEKSRLYSRRGSSLSLLHSHRSPDSQSKDSTTTPTQLSTPSTSPFGRRQYTNPLQRFAVADLRESPQFYAASSQSGSSRRGPFTPAKNKYSPNSVNGYSNCPNYMAKTESSVAKSRSQSAPRQRPECGRTSSMRRLTVQEFGDRASRSSTPKVKAYPGSGRLDRLGMPMDL